MAGASVALTFPFWMRLTSFLNSLLSFRNGGGFGAVDDFAMVVFLLLCLFDCELIEIVRIEVVGILLDAFAMYIPCSLDRYLPWCWRVEGGKLSCRWLVMVVNVK